MKKFLALVLALVMTMSLVTISSSAAFVDADSIEYDEAVNVLASLGVIQGKGANTFDPKGGVTRAEMAKMITYIKLGVADATAFEGTTVDLTDIDGHWAESFIKFCYVEGIIAGKGNGKFDPNANVTTAEAAKMLLVALGWNAEVQGYVGDQWKVAVIRDAYQNDLFEDIALGADKQLNRDESAKLIYNTTQTGIVEKISSMDRDDGGIGDQWKKQSDDVNLLSETFKAYKSVGIITFDEYVSAKKEYAYDGAFDGDAYDFPNGFNAKADYTALNGEEVAVVAKIKSATDYEILGVYPTGKSNVLSDVANAFSVESGKLKYDGKLYSLNGASTGDISRVSADLLKFVDQDGDGKYDWNSKVDVEVVKVTHVDSVEVLTNDGRSFKFADNQIADGIAADDYVAYSKNADGSYVVNEVEAVEAKLTSKNTADDKVEFNGTWYNVADADDGYTTSKTYRIWAHNGIIFNKEEVDGTDINNLVMVYAAATGNDIKGDEVAYIDATGTKTTVSIDKLKNDGSEGAGITGTLAGDYENNVYGQIYLKKVTSDGVEFRDISNIGSTYTANVATGLVFEDGKVVGIEKNNSGNVDCKIADDAVVFVYGTDNSAKVLTGKQLKAVAGADATFSISEADFYTKKVGLTNRATHLAVVYSGNVKDISAVTGTEIYAYVTSDSVYTTIEDTDAVRFTIWNGTENLTVYHKDTNAISKGTIISYKAINDNNVLSGFVNEGGTTAAVWAIDGKKVYLDSAESVGYEVNSDTKYLYINSNASKAEEIGKTDAKALALATQYGGSVHKVTMDNIAYVLDGSNFKVIVIDVANNMTRGNTAKIAEDSAVKNYTDTTSVKAGDRVELSVSSDANASVSFTNVMKSDGTGWDSSVTVAPGESVVVYVVANNTTIGIA